MTLLCDGRTHFEPCEAESAEVCQNGPSWHWTVFGEGGHAVAKCDGQSCPADGES